MQKPALINCGVGAVAIALASALSLGACARRVPAAQPAAAQPAAAGRFGHGPSAAATTPSAPLVRTESTGCLPSHDGYLRVRLRGASDLDVDWEDGQLQCAGDPRPAGRGIRLTFAGIAEPGAHHLRFVFGIDTPPGAGITRELAANVTVIFEGERRLYSTLGDTKCTVDQLRQQPLPASSSGALLRVSARGFCVAAAQAIGGSDELLVTRFDFAGQLSPGKPSDR